MNKGTHRRMDSSISQLVSLLPEQFKSNKLPTSDTEMNVPPPGDQPFKPLETWLKIAKDASIISESSVKHPQKSK